MYREEENNRGSILKTLLKVVIVIILFIIFILVLLKLFPTKQALNPLYEEIFRNNINSMKDAAETYYTNDRLPKEVGETVTMTLKEMLDKKLLLPFVDKYNKECDLNNSYVTITKTETEYELKVNLVCGKDEAYIIEHMGCNNKCALLDCSNGVTKEITEYQFVREAAKKVVDKYSCPSGYTLNNKKCYKESNVTDTKNAKPVYKPSSESIEATKEYTDKVVDVKDATPVYSESIVEPKTTVKYGEWSSPVTKEYLSITEKNLVDVKSCPSGYINYGTRTIEGNTVTRCIKKENSVNYGETDTVINKEAKYDNGSENYVKGPKKEYSTYYYSVGEVTIKTCKKYNYFIDTTTNYVYSYNGGGSTLTGIDFISCTNTCSLYPIFYTGSSSSNVSSHRAIGTVSNSLNVTCDVQTEKITRYAQGKKISSYNYEWYRKYTTQTRSKDVTYSCSDGYTLSADNKCVKRIITSYSCPSGYTKDGNTCKKIEKVLSYTCPNDYSLGEDNKCYKNTNVITGYTCDSGYKLDGKKCTRTYVKTDIKNAKASYKTIYQNEYKWSTSEKLSGWTRTGQKRTKKVTSDSNGNCVCN